MTRTSLPVSAITSGKSPSKASGGTKSSWFEDDDFILDVDCFVKTIATIKAKGASPDHIGSIIAHYASMRLPDFSGVVMTNPDEINHQQEQDSVTTYVLKRRFFVETLVGILPPERDSVACNFLLRLLKTVNMVDADPDCKAELEVRISWQLEQASLKDLMVPSFSHTCGTLLDVELVIRLVKKFARLYNEGFKSSASVIKVAKLVDSYLAEAAVDSYLSLAEFISLADALPRHSRVTENGLYRAMDTYLKAHPNVTKQERRKLCGIIGITNLSMDASLHAAENPRLPVRTIIQILFTELTTKLSHGHGRHNTNIDCSGSSSCRNPSGSHFSEPSPDSYMSKRDINVQQAEIRRLRDVIEKLESECETMRTQLKKEKKGGRKSTGNAGGREWYFRWKKLRFRSDVVQNRNGGQFSDTSEVKDEFECENQAPVVGDVIPSSRQVDDTEEPTTLIVPDQPMKKNRKGKNLRKAMKKLMEKFVEDDRKISTASSSTLKVDKETNPQDHSLPHFSKFGLITKTTRINDNIHAPDDCDPHTLKSGGFNQPVSGCYC